VNADDESMNTNDRKYLVEVNDILTLYSGELQSMNNPGRIARSHLSPNEYGWTENAYSEESFKLWGNLLNRFPDDIEVMHHLAIMYHARAIDIESGSNPHQSDSDWEMALKLWYKICQNDEFWKRLSNKISDNRNCESIIAEQRINFRKRLLKMHFDIAFDPKTTKNHRINYHIKLAMTSPFDTEIREDVRQQVYEEFIQLIDQQAWSTDMLDAEIINPALKVIADYLEKDPGYIVALSDLLRLISRLIILWHQKIKALDPDDPERKKLINTCLSESKKWEPYISQLRKVQDDLDFDLREKMSFWYRTIADIHCICDQHEMGGHFYKCASEATTDEEIAIKFMTSAGIAFAQNARELAVSKQQGDRDRARRLCDDLLNFPNLSVISQFILANSYIIFGELDIAEDICQQGLAMEVESFDLEEIEALEEGKTHLRSLLETISRGRIQKEINELIKSATEDLKNSNSRSALNTLIRAIALKPDDNTLCYILSMRCQCYLREHEPDNAKRDIQRIRSLNIENDQQLIEAINRMERDCDILAKEISMFTREGMQLHNDSYKDLDSKNYEEAERKLRKAIQLAGREGQQVLKGELSMLLFIRANEKLGKILKKLEKKEEVDRTHVENTMRECKKIFVESLQLDPSNKKAKESVDFLNPILSQIDEQTARARVQQEQIRELEREFGGIQAFELQQKGVKAFNAGNCDDAINYLRQAVKASYNPERVEKELAQILVHCAMTKFQKTERMTPDILDMIQEAQGLDPGIGGNFFAH
jgi:tetratricopeptide (TPR) repeat protein